MSLQIIKNPQFVDLDTVPHKGLTRIKSCWKELISAIRIWYFKNFTIPSQPSFFISKEHWDLLLNGETISVKNGKWKWLDEEYEVYAFVFCIAFYEPRIVVDTKEQQKEDNLKDKAYFRIRSIVKRIDAKPNLDEKSIEAFVELDNIAYVDLHSAIVNEDGDCIKFIASEDFDKDEIRDKLAKVNREVISTRIALSTRVIKNEKFDEKKSLLFNTPLSFGSLSKQGHIFGKKRIEGILNRSYKNEVKGTKISLMLDESSREIKFHFKVNPEYITEELPCPIPTVC